MILGIIALAVSVISAGLSAWAIKYARQQAAAAAITAGYAGQQAAAAAITAAHDSERRHNELSPRVRVSIEPGQRMPRDEWEGPGFYFLRMRIKLDGPAEIERLDQLTVSIRDTPDHPGQGVLRLQPGQAAPTWEQKRRVVWSRWSFDPVKSDDRGRTALTKGVPVGESRLFILEQTLPPLWLALPVTAQSEGPQLPRVKAWQERLGPVLLLRLECVRQGYEPWLLFAEILIGDDGRGFAEIPAKLG